VYDTSYKYKINYTTCFRFFYCSYYRCKKAQSHFCKGSAKQLVDGTKVAIQPHNGHVLDIVDNRALINDFRNILRRRAATENTLLKNMYDEEARR